MIQYDAEHVASATLMGSMGGVVMLELKDGKRVRVRGRTGSVLTRETKTGRVRVGMEETDSMIEFGNSTEIIAGGVQQDQ
jgi:hypothetical protein